MRFVRIPEYKFIGYVELTLTWECVEQFKVSEEIIVTKCFCYLPCCAVVWTKKMPATNPKPSVQYYGNHLKASFKQLQRLGHPIWCVDCGRGVTEDEYERHARMPMCDGCWKD